MAGRDAGMQERPVTGGDGGDRGRRCQQLDLRARRQRHRGTVAGERPGQNTAADQQTDDTRVSDHRSRRATVPWAPAGSAGAASVSRPAPHAAPCPSDRRSGAPATRTPAATRARTPGSRRGGSTRRDGAQPPEPSPHPRRTTQSTGQAASDPADGHASPEHNRSTTSTATAHCPTCDRDHASTPDSPSTDHAQDQTRSPPQASPDSATARPASPSPRGPHGSAQPMH